MEPLKIAENCLKKRIEEQEKWERLDKALMFQFCLQMGRFADSLSKKEIRPDYREEFKSQARIFRALAKLYRGRSGGRTHQKVGKNTGGELDGGEN